MNATPCPILYMPMEIASRELDSRLLLASLALARGYEVVIGQKWLMELNIPAMPPGLYLSKTLTQRDGIAMAEAKKRGYAVAAIDEELPGLMMTAKQLRWMSPEAVKTTDVIFVAGSRNAGAVGERFPEAAKRIVQAANPRWDLLRADMRQYYDREVDAIRQRYGQFILINTNLGFTNSEKGSADQIIREQERGGKLDMKNPEHTAYVASIIEMETKHRAAIEQLLEELPKRFPEFKIVLRPHPSESLETWHKAAAGKSNVTVIRSGAAASWISASMLLIHTNCTTGVEALALDKPAICLIASQSPANDRYLANRVNPVTRSVSETLDLVARILPQPLNGIGPAQPFTETMRQLFRDAMSYQPSKLGAEAILDTIHHIVPAPGNQSSTENRSFWSPSWRYRWKLPDKNVRGQLMPELDLADLTDRLTRVCSFLHIAPPATISNIGSKVALLSNRPLSRATTFRQAMARYL